LGKSEKTRLLEINMKKDEKIYVAGHTGMVGSALIKRLKDEGYNNLVFYSHKDLDLINQQDVSDFFHKEKPEYVFWLQEE
jgi:GDP-L-fucose synthase